MGTEGWPHCSSLQRAHSFLGLLRASAACSPAPSASSPAGAPPADASASWLPPLADGSRERSQSSAANGWLASASLNSCRSALPHLTYAAAGRRGQSRWEG